MLLEEAGAQSGWRAADGGSYFAVGSVTFGLPPAGPFHASGRPRPALAAGHAPDPFHTGLARAASPDHNPT